MRRQTGKNSFLTLKDDKERCLLVTEAAGSTLLYILVVKGARQSHFSSNTKTLGRIYNPRQGILLQTQDREKNDML